MNTKLEVDPTFQLNLDAVCAQFSIQSIDFIQYKGFVYIIFLSF